MPFRKNDDHAGSGLDKPEPKGLLARIADWVKGAPPSKTNPGKPPVS